MLLLGRVLIILGIIWYRPLSHFIVITSTMWLKEYLLYTGLIGNMQVPDLLPIFDTHMQAQACLCTPQRHDPGHAKKMALNNSFMCLYKVFKEG